MRVGVGLPNTISGVDGSFVLEWARRTEAGPFSSLGVLTEQLVALKDHWEARTHVPSHAAGRPGGPPLLVGGSSGDAFARMARYADGYVHGGGPPRAFAGAAGRAV